MQLSLEQRTKLDDGNDALFYQFPRWVTHVDDGFIRQLTELYRQRLKPQGKILDLMSSWVSHLPEEMSFEHVEGHGLNEEELAKNHRFNHYFTQNLNQSQELPFAPETFDAVICCVSVQYLQYPEAIFTEIHRILKVGGIVIISFSNRMFFQKAIKAWREGSENDRIRLVFSYCAAVPQGFTRPELVANVPPTSPFLSMIGISSGDPFYAVVATRCPLPDSLA